MNTNNKHLIKAAQKSKALNFNSKYLQFVHKDSVIYVPSDPGKFVNGNFVEDSNIELTELDVPTFTNCAAILDGEKLDDLKPWIKKAFNFVCKDELRPVMNGVYIDKNCIVSTDANILYKKQFEQEISPENLILSPLTCQCIDELKAIYKVDKKFMALLNCGTIIENCEIEGKYPNYNAVIPNEFEGSFTINCVSNEFKEALKLNEQQNNCIKLNFDNNCFDWENLDNNVSGKIDIKIHDKTNHKTDELILLMNLYDKNNNYYVAYNQKLIDKISKGIKQHELVLNYRLNKSTVIYLPETTNKPTKTKKVMEKTETKQSVDTDILSALMQQINELSKQVAELKNQQISTPKNNIEPIKESAKIEEQTPIEIVKPIINVQKYSDKSLIVYGDTKQIKEKLMQLHARFNPYLKLNDVKTPGWIVSVKHEEAINQIVQTL